MTTSKTVTNHYLQSDEWAAARVDSDWKLHELPFAGNNVRLYAKHSPLGSVLLLAGYAPNPKDIPALTQTLKQHYSKAFICKLETCEPKDDLLVTQLKASGWVPGRTTQYAYTVRLDLTKSVEQLKKDMKKRARNELNRAVANDVMVTEQEVTDDTMTTMHKLLKSTAARKQFSVHDRQFAFTYWQAMAQAGRLRLFFTKRGDDMLAACVILISGDGKTAWYKESASTRIAPQLNGPRLMLWEIAQKLKQSGVETFDLGGIPDPATYEQSSMRGIFIFKTAYTPEITQMMPVYELVLKPRRYKLWPKVEVALRKYGQKRNTNWY